MPGQHTEKAFETAIEHHLTTAGGYEQGNREAFDRDRGLFAGDVVSFVQKTSPTSGRIWPTSRKTRPRRRCWTTSVGR